MTRAQLHPRGATLIELMVSLSLMAVVLAVTIGVIVGAAQSGARARARAGLARQGQYLNTLLSNELRMAGLGVPAASGTHIDDAYAGAGDTTFDTDVILATSTSVGIVGDFPRPTRQYNTLGTLDGHAAGGPSDVMWHTENNGSCAPQTGSGSCSTASTSLFFPGESGCNTGGAVDDRTCPWGMRRVSDGESIQVVSGAMRWTHAHASNPLTMSTFGTNGLLSLHLSTAWSSAVWPNDSNSAAPTAVTGEGFVTSIDRVFYFFDSSAHTISRIQCFGDPAPQDTNWPNLANNTLPSISSLEVTPNGGSQNTCVGPEVVAQHVETVQLDYFDNTGATAAGKAAVTRIDWTIKLRTVVDGRQVDQDVVGTAKIRNLS